RRDSPGILSIKNRMQRIASNRPPRLPDKKTHTKLITASSPRISSARRWPATTRNPKQMENRAMFGKKLQALAFMKVMPGCLCKDKDMEGSIKKANPPAAARVPLTRHSQYQASLSRLARKQ